MCKPWNKNAQVAGAATSGRVVVSSGAAGFHIFRDGILLSSQYEALPGGKANLIPASASACQSA